MRDTGPEQFFYVPDGENTDAFGNWFIDYGKGTWNHEKIVLRGDASDARGLLATAEAARGKIENATVILDPPRKGSTPELITYLAERNFDRIVYVSCNPDTLARDCAFFRKLGYNIGAVTPVDMFPRTGHVESVVCLTRKEV